jgi:hypothetical protein
MERDGGCHDWNLPMIGLEIQVYVLHTTLFVY